MRSGRALVTYVRHWLLVKGSLVLHISTLVIGCPAAHGHNPCAYSISLHATVRGLVLRTSKMVLLRRSEADGTNLTVLARNETRNVDYHATTFPTVGVTVYGENSREKKSMTETCRVYIIIASLRGYDEREDT
ncbi:hypothetical protein IF1G_09443 [Cordyceps javanica]|uniref:Secreted protein n=1 Tax=Cordyceps javanica TaxID=43265 RepID=A0A545UQY2_9HYPO|nr:hypothetical protein IF1G_09443 [Cordyceps javanica]